MSKIASKNLQRKIGKVVSGSPKETKSNGKQKKIIQTLKVGCPFSGRIGRVTEEYATIKIHGLFGYLYFSEHAGSKFKKGTKVKAVITKIGIGNDGKIKYFLKEKRRLLTNQSTRTENTSAF